MSFIGQVGQRGFRRQIAAAKSSSARFISLLIPRGISLSTVDHITGSVWALGLEELSPKTLLITL